MLISVALIASCNTKNSFLKLSLVWASLSKADLVRALGAIATEELIPIFFLGASFEDTGVTDRGVAELDLDCPGVGPSVLSPPPSSSSTPNDNFGVPVFLFFFFRCSLGVDALYYGHQLHALSQNAQAGGTHPSGVTVPGVPRPLPPLRNASCASRSFCSRASARRFRKSERATSPTVWVLRRSSAVFVCEVKRGFGVDDPEGGVDAIVEDMESPRVCLLNYDTSRLSSCFVHFKRFTVAQLFNCWPRSGCGLNAGHEA